MKPVAATLHLPCRCLVCGQWAAAALCAPCLARFAAEVPRCRCCALAWPVDRQDPSAAEAVAAINGARQAGSEVGPAPEQGPCADCRARPPAHSHAVTLANYGFPWDRLIARFKFNQQPELAGALARPLAQAVATRLARPGWPRPDWVLPVPLSGSRLAERGYNQAWVLAQHLARQLGLPAWAHGLERWLDTPHQVGASRAQRLANLQGAMGVPASARQRLLGRQVALVDDVLTTGITAQAAAQALRAAGAAGVQVWVLARTPAPASA